MAFLDKNPFWQLFGGLSISAIIALATFHIGPSRDEMTRQIWAEVYGASGDFCGNMAGDHDLDHHGLCTLCCNVLKGVPVLSAVLVVMFFGFTPIFAAYVCYHVRRAGFLFVRARGPPLIMG